MVALCSSFFRLWFWVLCFGCVRCMSVRVVGDDDDKNGEVRGVEHIKMTYKTL